MLKLKRPIIYITRDLERAIGLELDTPDYYIISNSTEFAKKTSAGRKNVFLIEAERLLNTHELLEHPETIKFVNSIKNAAIIVFKPTAQIENLCQAHGWPFLNPAAKLASPIEEKITQLEFLPELRSLFPAYEVTALNQVRFEEQKIVIQYNHSHTGSGTVLIDNESDLAALQEKFPNRPVRVAQFIEGPLFTNNNIVAGEKIFIGNISYQITGLVPFTDNPFATIGNDWTLPKKILSEKLLNSYYSIVTKVGAALAARGWRGLFGIDVILDQANEKLYLLEINARQPASTAFESILQLEARKNGTTGLTTFELHLLALENCVPDKSRVIEIALGAQIIKRVTTAMPNTFQPIVDSPPPWNYIVYKNTKHNEDLIRLQTFSSIMDGHNKLNNIGVKMVDFVVNAFYGKSWGRPRAGFIVIKDKQILLLRRNKFGRQFYTIPGGTVEAGENLVETAIRELKEETGLKCTPLDAPPLTIKGNWREETYFVAAKFSGTPRLGGEEAEKTTPENEYALEWVDISKINSITFAQKILIEAIKRL